MPHSHFLGNLDGIHETGGAKSLRPESGLIFVCTSEILVMSLLECVAHMETSPEHKNY